MTTGVVSVSLPSPITNEGTNTLLLVVKSLHSLSMCYNADCVGA